ncbi:hypothetical protein, partial [Klebsiella pneumoniae]|uniref:hypothetical protein n=1 Tax=Klebsiella pneumoniae TaxID=573 RepID=UPI00210AEAC1
HGQPSTRALAKRPASSMEDTPPHNDFSPFQLECNWQFLRGHEANVPLLKHLIQRIRMASQPVYVADDQIRLRTQLQQIDSLTRPHR